MTSDGILWPSLDIRYNDIQKSFTNYPMGLYWIELELPNHDASLSSGPDAPKIIPHEMSGSCIQSF